MGVIQLEESSSFCADIVTFEFKGCISEIHPLNSKVAILCMVEHSACTQLESSSLVCEL